MQGVVAMDGDSRHNSEKAMAERIKNISVVNLVNSGSVVIGDVVYLPGGVCGPWRGYLAENEKG